MASDSAAAIMSLHWPMSDPGVTTGHQHHRMTRPGLLSLDLSLSLSPPLQLSLNFTTINWGLRTAAARQWECQLGLIITTLLTNLDLIIS